MRDKILGIEKMKSSVKGIIEGYKDQFSGYKNQLLLENSTLNENNTPGGFLMGLKLISF